MNWFNGIGSSLIGKGFGGNIDLRQTNIAVSNIKETRIWIIVIGANLRDIFNAAFCKQKIIYFKFESMLIERLFKNGEAVLLW